MLIAESIHFHAFVPTYAYTDIIHYTVHVSVPTYAYIIQYIYLCPPMQYMYTCVLGFLTNDLSSVLRP